MPAKKAPAKDKENKKIGRPLKNISKAEFEKLCALQCTREEICSFFDVSEKTLDGWCKRNYKDEEGNEMTFSLVFAQKRGLGRISLRRNQFQLAKKNAAMAIFLGKNFLGQSENGLREDEEDQTDDGFISALKSEGQDVWTDE